MHRYLFRRSFFPAAASSQDGPRLRNPFPVGRSQASQSALGMIPVRGRGLREQSSIASLVAAPPVCLLSNSVRFRMAVLFGGESEAAWYRLRLAVHTSSAPAVEGVGAAAATAALGFAKGRRRVGDWKAGNGPFIGSRTVVEFLFHAFTSKFNHPAFVP
ncbi:unnamed protein product [Phaeothamnion confervicola]